ncbi:fibronectin type III domain-containing protein [Nocardioides litoris]|uniref:fibronectin type III domain-containing protein n=1 Tax=Nocardioides litoris TaxID=1926648 RepID=UPI00111D2796|nr:fibronectin type III domain-containing protein [Nocardioides litoris]
MTVTASIRRHRVALASHLAVLVAVAGIVVVATQADGYRKHDAQLNDGGIWVTNGRDGFHGRINKPIAQLDGVAFTEQDTQLDVVQDGAAVLGVDVSAGSIAVIDPATVSLPDGATATLPAAAQVQLAGGTAAVLDPAEGTLWTQRVDTRLGVPPVEALDAESDPYAETAAEASLAVAQSGEVLVATASDDTLRRWPVAGTGLGAPTSEPLGADLGPGTTVTAVGDRAVVLDGESGSLQVVGGADADLPPGSRLQAPGPAADDVLVGTGDGLVAVDLATGEVRELAGDVAGRPAEPVRLGACAYGAWSGGSAGAVATACDGAQARTSPLGAETSDLVFRVNRGEIVLNDRTSGAVWDIESDQPTRLDNWDAFQLEPSKKDDENENENDDQGDRRPPQAKDDDLGARVGRTTVLHPLDNDTAPAGRLLAISSVDAGDADVTISPDGQSVQLTLARDAGPTTFDYTINDGRSGLSDTATVRVTPRGDDENAQPQLRPGFEPRTWQVPSGGTLDVPVLPDWRDKDDGDPLALDSATVTGGERTGAVARTTAAGRVRFTAPTRSGVVVVRYAVTDGIGEPVPAELEIQVQDLQDRRAYAGVAEPDVVAGEAGKTLTIRPLANDLPGSDPVNPTAVAELAGKVAQVGGAEVRTDMVDGTISFTADQPRTYFLDYDLRYGNAPFADGRIRVDVKAPDNPPDAPVAMPDSLVLYGQAASLVDVVANDIDPTGGILVVQDVAADRPDDLDVAVVEGRWLRISARGGELPPTPQLVRYSISNGARSGVKGQVSVAWRPPPADNTPVTEDDKVVVRAGGVVSVPVLDNDFSPAGDELDLVSQLPEEPAGVLPVRQPGNETGVETGRAFVTDRFVRYVAPEEVEDAETFTVRYLATNAAGDRAPGTLEVQVVPGARRNEPPAPPVLEGRAVAGDTIKLRVPGAGVDPDGDPVTLTGIDSAPGLGRVLRYGATSLVYQAYPGSVGTDEFGYTVTDGRGGTASGSVRVAVTAPGTPQPPLAVPDTLTTEPGRLARIDVLANDHVAAGDRVTVELVGDPPGARLESPQGPLLVEVPEAADGEAPRDVEVVYTVGNGIDSSRSTATVRTARPFNNPPVVFDAFGTPAVATAGDQGGQGDVDGTGDGATVTVDVLETAYDPDGDDGAVRVTEVLAPAGVQVGLAGSEVTVTRGDEPLVVPFRVEDAGGGSATASVYVPPRAGGAPYVVPGAVVQVDPGATTALDLADYVVDPSGGPVQFTLRDRISGSPAASVQPRVTGEGRFEVSAADRYQGPGAVVFEVTTGTSVDDPDGVEATLSVPVQVGADDPILRCPDEPVRIAQDRDLALDIASLCHVWTPDPEAAAELSFDADWESSVDGLVIVDPSGPTIEVNADGATAPGSRAVLLVRAGDGEPGRIEVLVEKSPPPSLVPIRLADMRAGQERTIDLATYLRPGVRNPQPTVVSVEPRTELDVAATYDGSVVTLRTGPQVDGRAEFEVVMSDVAGSAGAERQARGRLVLDVLDRPDTPTAPVPGNAVRDQEVALSWRAPPANGAPIDRFQVRGGGEVRECGSTRCEVGGLVNGRDYRFEVRAHNAVGWSEWSPPSAVATPDARPDRVGTVVLAERGDTFLKLSWAPPANQTSAIKQYVVSWQDGGSAVTRRPEVTASGLDNNRAYTFTVYAVNQTFTGERRTSGAFQSIGVPATPDQPTITEARASSDETVVTVSWPPVDPPNGPGPVRYTVLRDGQPLPACTDIVATRCDNGGIQYDGRTYSYTVRATNEGGRGLTSGVSRAATFQAVGEPEPWDDWSIAPTGANNAGTASYTVPDSNGARSLVRLYRDGSEVSAADATGQRTTAVQTQDNNGPHTFQLEVCNEAGACVRSAEKVLQTYGPLARQHIINMTPEVDGRRVRWSVTVDTNGDPATLRVERVQSNATASLSVDMSINAVDTYSFTTGWNDIGYRNTEELRLRLFDRSPDRGPAERQASSPQTADPPPPTVTIAQGPKCSGAGGGTENCTGGEVCVNRSCARIQFSSENWAFNPMFCDLVDTRSGEYLSDRQIATNRTVSPGPYYGYPGQTVQARCGDSSGRILAESNRLVWPNN